MNPAFFYANARHLALTNLCYKTGLRGSLPSDKLYCGCKDGVYFLQTPKNGKGRVIVPAQVAMDALRDKKERQVNNQQAYGECWHNPENYVFTDMLGKHLVRRTVVKHFKAVIDRAGIKNVRFHDLRHSFAVNSLMIGDDVKTVQTNLGLATASFTLDVYGHVTQKMKNDSAERMQQFLMP